MADMPDLTVLTPEATQALASTPTADLLTAAYSLTHRIHVGEGRGRSGRRMTDVEVDGLRAQRDLIDVEIERRCRPREPRYSVRADGVHYCRYGVWDGREGTWYSGNVRPEQEGFYHCDSGVVWAAGVPLWPGRRVPLDFAEHLNLGGR